MKTIGRMVGGAVGFVALHASAATIQDVAIHYAPVLYQDTADGFPNDWRNRRYDLITRYDFDGGPQAADNWATAESWKLPGFVYFEAQETATHVFLVYGFYHPRDWDNGCFYPVCHENDQENYRLTIAKDGTEFGTPILLDGDSHGYHNAYAIGPTVTSGRTTLKSGTPTFDGSHVRMFVEAKGHGPTLCGDDADCRSKLAGGDGVVYRVTAGGSSPAIDEPDVEPLGIVDADYGLLPSFEELWSRIPIDSEDAFNSNEAVVYQGGRFSLSFPVPRQWNSDDFGSEGDGTMTWGVKFVSDGGADRLLDWGFDPALSVKEHFTVAGEDDPALFSMEYTCNPYFGIYASCPDREPAVTPGAEPGTAPDVWPVWKAVADDRAPRYPGCSVACQAGRGAIGIALGMLAMVLVVRRRRPTSP